MTFATSPPTDFFHDCPWLNIPPHRQAIINEEPQHPRGRLLGGSSKDGKMSKLAALAAKRRKEKESQKSSSAESPSEPSDYTERLKQLHVTQPSPSRKKSEEEHDQSRAAEGRGASTLKDVVEEVSTPRHNLPEAGLVHHLRRPPSAFATVVTHKDDNLAANAGAPLSTDTLSPKSAFDFSQPSPDDVFRRAQGSK